MRSLNTLADQGKILYLGVSDTPAWIVSKANQYARDHGLRPFVVYQGRWSASNRDFERDIIPMCEAEGMALAPWGTWTKGATQSRGLGSDSALASQRQGEQYEVWSKTASQCDIWDTVLTWTLCSAGAIGGGNYKTEEQRQSGEGRNLPGVPETDIIVSKVLEDIAKEKDTLITSVA
jgi:hypothetical protein